MQVKNYTFFLQNFLKIFKCRTMANVASVSTEIGDDGIAIITINNPPVNALALSGGNGKFSGGFDVNVIQKVQQTGDISLLPSASVDLITNTIEDGKKPSVAAIDGFALGGGLELAMGCAARMATPRTELGLPELKLGVIPGCGGTQRLPRLIGVPKAVEMMLSSKIVTSEEGKEYGLIDSIVSSEELLTVSRRWALDIIEGLRPHTRSLKKTEKLGSIDSSCEVLDNARLNASKTFPNMPHYIACLDVIEEGIRFGGFSGVLKEDKVFKELVLSSSAKGLVHAFFAERATSKVPNITDSGLSPRRIGKIAVIGSGFVCSTIATDLIISDMQVILKETNVENLQKLMESIEDALQTLVVEGYLQPDKIKKTQPLLKGVLDYQEFQTVDMVIEAVDDEILLKQSIFEQLESVCSPHCILASTTSSTNLSIIGERTRSQDRFVGVNFFRPAHVKPLLEIVQTESTSKQVIQDLVKFAKTIKKVPIVVKNTTGFAVKRSFFPYTQGAEILANLGADVFRIDRVIREFGMELGPFQLQDVTGYQVYLKDVKDFAAAFPDRSFSSPLVQLMMESGRQGKESGKGYYTYEMGRKPEPDLSVVEIIEKSAILTNINRSEKTISLTNQEIVEMIFFPMVNEACRVLEEGIVARASDLDIASIHGMNFPSYRGGIVFWGDSVGPEYIYSRLKNWYEIYGNFYKPSKFLEEWANKGTP